MAVSTARPSGRRIFVAALLLAAIGGGIAVSEWNKPHRDYAAESPESLITSEALFAAFSSNPAAALETHGNQVLRIEGTVRSADATMVIFAPGVVCRWAEPPTSELPRQGETASVKARVLSFDDLLGEVNADHAVLD